MVNYSSLESMISNVVEIVQKMYYSYVPYYLWDDLRQEGYLAIWNIIHDGNIDPYRNLRTYCFAVARNAMSAYMYHERKHDDLLSLDELVQEGSVQDVDLIRINRYTLSNTFIHDSYFNDNQFTDSEVKHVCYRFSDFGDYEEITKQNLHRLGLYQCEHGEKHKLSSIEEAILGILIYEKIGSLSYID